MLKLRNLPFRLLPRQRFFTTNQYVKSFATEYSRSGVVCLKNVIEPQWIEELKRGVAKNIESPHPEYSESLQGPTKGGFFFNDYCNWQRIPEFQNFIYNSPIAQMAKDIMQSKTVTFYHEHVLVKEPLCSRPTPWHHDQPYYPLDGHQNVSFWIPLDSIFQGENSIDYIVGSHKNGRWYRPRKFESLQGYPLTEAELDKTDWGKHHYEELHEEQIEQDLKDGKIHSISWDMAPGDVVAFNFLTLHGAGGNSTHFPRRIVAFRFVGDDVTVTTKRPWKDVSPPIYGGLTHGQKLSESKLFPDLTALTV